MAFLGIAKENLAMYIITFIFLILVMIFSIIAFILITTENVQFDYTEPAIIVVNNLNA